MASNEVPQADFLMELTSPQSSVDTAARDRVVVQQELEKKLRLRADREHLVQKNILPDFSSSPILFQHAKELQKNKNADSLQKKLRNRPEKQNLMQMNILPVDVPVNVDPGLMSKQMSLKRNRLADTLNRKLASRPGPLELVQGRILEPHNPEIAEAVRTVFETSDETVKSSDSPPSTNREVGLPRQATSLTSPHAEFSPPLKDALTSPLSDTGLPSPEDVSEEMSSPGHKRIMSPQFNLTQMVAPSPKQAPSSVTQTPGIVVASRKSLSPSQARKKQQKQKYRKLRYHEYVPPTKNNGKGGKTNPKPLPKQETPYNHILQQQQLFLQLQVLQQQYPNGVLMQKLPDIVDSLSKSGNAGKGKATSPSGGGSGGSVTMSVPQVVMVEQPNQFQINSIRFEELKVSDLKGACKEMGMIVSGKKAELVERLLEHNNGYLPVVALPESQTRDVQRSQSTHPMHHSVHEPQVPMSTFSPPSPTSSSPVFKFPADQTNTGGRNLNDISLSVAGNARKGSLSSISSMVAPQVIPALSLQQQFDELVERQKRSYICQGQAPKPLAPRPELGDMVAIKFPCPVETQPRENQSQPQQQQQRPNKVVTLPRQGSESTSKMVVSPFNKQSHSLPSSPKPLSPENSTSQLLSEMMDDSSSEQPKSLEGTLQVPTSNRGSKNFGSGGVTPPPQPQAFMSSAPSNTPVTATSNGPPFTGVYSHTSHHAPAMATSNYYPQQQSRSKPPLRQSQSLSLSMRGVMLPPKLHPSNPPPPYGTSNSGMVQRSMSLNHPYQQGLHHPRLQSGASFGSDTSDLLNPQEGFVYPDELGATHMELPLEAQMDTTESNQLSEIFSILEGDPTGFAVPGQPPSYSNKLSSARQDSVRSDSVMLGSGLAYQSPNPPLSHIHKSNSDLCLVETHKHAMNPPPYTGAMLGSSIGWLDPSDSSGMMSDVSPNIGSLGLSNSNPGSLTHEGFQMNFLDDLNSHKHTNAPTNTGMNGFSQGEYLTHSLPTTSGLLYQQDESQTLLELGLSS